MVLIQCPACGGNGIRYWNPSLTCTHEYGSHQEIPDGDLLRLLQEGDWRDKMWASTGVAQLAQGGADVSAYVEPVIDLFQDRDFVARGFAVFNAGLLRRSGVESQRIEEGVLAAFGDIYFLIRAVSIMAAVEMHRAGSRRAPDIEALVITGCSDRDPEVRAAAVTASADLFRLGSKNPHLESSVRKCLSDSSPTARGAAEKAWLAWEPDFVPDPPKPKASQKAAWAAYDPAPEAAPEKPTTATEAARSAVGRSSSE